MSCREWRYDRRFIVSHEIRKSIQVLRKTHKGQRVGDVRSRNYVLESCRGSYRAQKKDRASAEGPTTLQDDRNHLAKHKGRL